MKIDFTQPVIGLDGKPFTEGSDPISLSKLCVNALLGTYQDEPNLTGEEKFRRYDLASKIKDRADAEILIEDVAVVKKLVGKCYGVAIVGPIYMILEARA